MLSSAPVQEALHTEEGKSRQKKPWSVICQKVMEFITALMGTTV